MVRSRGEYKSLTFSSSAGYSHENPRKMTVEQQRDVLDHTLKQLTEFCGKPPRGHSESSSTFSWEISQDRLC